MKIICAVAGAVLSVAFVAPSYGQGPNKCVRFMNAFEHASKVISLTYAEGIADNSAPRATSRNLEMNNWLQVKRMNLDLMMAHKCQLPDEPVLLADYIGNALECSTARLKNPRARSLSECDFDRWQRSMKK